MPQTRRLPGTSDVLRHLSLLVLGSLRRSSGGVETPDAEVLPRAGELPGDLHV